MPGNTTNQYPYPLATEPVAQGASAIQSLAQAVDTRLGARSTGQVNANFNNTAVVNVSVTFPSGRFQATQTPKLLANANGTAASQFIVGTLSISNTGATMAVRDYQANNRSITIAIDWYAST